MPRQIHRSAEGDLADVEVAEIPASHPFAAHPAGKTGPLIPDHVVNFLNDLPMTGDVVEWIDAFRDTLRRMLGDVDRVAIRVNTHCNLNNPEEQDTVMVEHVQHARNSHRHTDTIVDTKPWEGRAPAEQFIDELQALGHSLSEYHPPVNFDYYYAGSAYIGTILLFRERGKQPISERTRSAMKALEPFLVFALSDLVTRHHYAKPTDRIFNGILDEVARSSNLSVQDIRILSLMLMGLSYKQVADRMELSIDTIRKHTKRIYRKTRTGSLPELFAKYFSPRLGIEGLGEDESL